MSTKDIRTHHVHAVCDVCGRTLLRGEHSEVYINGAARRSVCELCKTRALHEGWVREGTLPAYDAAGVGSDRRRSLFGRLRRRTDGSGPGAVPTLDDRLSDEAWAAEGSAAAEAPTPVPPSRAPARAATRERREPRHVRAVPTNDEHKIASAIDLFNRSEHRRTVSGVARSLGAPVVSVAPDRDHPSRVWIVISWELCWYRYEVDLSDDVPSVRVDGQGYELAELVDHERVPNAAADDVGQLTLR